MRLFIPWFLAVTALAVAPDPASAKVLLITRGDSFSHLGEVNEAKRPPQLPFTSVGFKYSYFGVFWLDLWRYDGQYCLYRDEDYIPLSREEAAMFLDVPESQVEEPFFYNVPPGLIIVGVIGIALAIGGIARQIQKQKVMALVSDPRYQKALEIFRDKIAENQAAKAAAAEKNEPAPAEMADPWEAAVHHLVAEGVERSHAEAQFGKVLAYAMERAHEQPVATESS